MAYSNFRRTNQFSPNEMPKVRPMELSFIVFRLDIGKQRRLKFTDQYSDVEFLSGNIIPAETPQSQPDEPLAVRYESSMKAPNWNFMRFQ